MCLASNFEKKESWVIITSFEVLYETWKNSDPASLAVRLPKEAWKQPRQKNTHISLFLKRG